MALTAGSIAFTGFNGDGNDNLSFVTLTDIPQGTVINFTDSNWNGSSFATGSSSESTMAWTATTAIAAGTVIDINNIGKGTLGASSGSVTFTNANNTGLSNDSEVVYAYVGSSTSPTFLAAISNVGYSTSDGTLTGTGLVAGQTAISFTGGLDIMAYNGSRSGQTSFAAYLAAINNPANWITQNGSGDQSTDGIAPDAPFPTTAFTVTAPAAQQISFSPSNVSVAEGDSGTKTMTFTIQRTGGTTGIISFSGTFAAGTTNAADFGGTLPNATFSGTIADGATSATVTITISGDTTPEPDESFTLTLTSASNPSTTVTLGTATATGTITNDDGTVLSSNSSTPITLANNDHLTILTGVRLSGSTPVTWVGGSTSPGALLDNFGTVTGTSRAVYTSGSTGGSFTIHNEAGATITATKDAVKISNLVSGTSGTFTVNNEGTISSTGTGSNAGQALDLDDINSSGVNTVINNAAGGVISAADADAIRGGAHATINNYGQIVSHNASAASSGNDAIDFQSINVGGVVNNYAGGVIDGARHGITGDQPITVTNDGTITGEAGSGINMDTAGTTTTTVTNRGIITGTSVNGADADGVDVDGLVSIDNFGTIQALGIVSVANGRNEAIAIGGGSVHNELGGVIVSDQRAITVDDSNDGSAFGATTIINDGTIEGKNGEAISITGTFGDTITNNGTITGRIDMGGGNDTLTNSGTITGDVLTGAGDDTINLVTGSIISGTLDGGAGNDTLYLSGSGLGTLSNRVTNVENLVVAGGTWTAELNGDGIRLPLARSWSVDPGQSGYTSIIVKSGAKLGVSASESLEMGSAPGQDKNDHLVVEAGGEVGALVDAGQFGAGSITIDNAGTIASISMTTDSTKATFVVNNAVTGIISNTISGPGDLNGGSLTIVNDGAISGAKAIDLENVRNGSINVFNHAGGIISAIANQDVIRGGTGTVIENAGTIRSDADAGESISGGDAIDYKKNGGGTVRNLAGGLIEGSHHAVTGKVGITVVNEQGATMIGRNGSAVNVDNNASVANTVYVTNRGTMIGASAGYSDSDGDAIDTDGLVKLDNYGLVEGIGANGYHKGEVNVSEGVAIGGGTINNYAGATIYGYGRAIQVDNSSNGPAFASTTIYNEGLIRGDGHGPTGVAAADAAAMQARIDNREAIDILGSFADTITNKGAILGGVFTDGGNDTLTNSGLMVAQSVLAVDMGDGADTLTNSGAIAGSVQMGAGDDTINLLTGSIVTGTIDGGDGIDTINLSGTGNGTLGTVTNVEKLDIQSGIWTIGDATGYSGITVEDGATAIVTGSAGATAVAAGGTEYVYGTASGSVISGVQVVQSGGSASDTTINSGGEQDVLGTANGTIVAGGAQVVYGTVSDTTVEDGGLQQVVLGTATGTTIDNGGQQNVYADATATGTIVNAGATQVDWGNATGTTINGGNQYVWGTASNTNISSGAQYVGAGGVASDTTIGAGGFEVVLAGGAAHNVIFGGESATLALEDSSALTGSISGWQANDRIDLGDILFSDGATSLAYAQNGDNSGGTLTVSDGTHVATLNLLGQYSAADFALSSDGHGGTFVFDPSVAGPQAQLAVSQHA